MPSKPACSPLLLATKEDTPLDSPLNLGGPRSHCEKLQSLQDAPRPLLCPIGRGLLCSDAGMCMPIVDLGCGRHPRIPNVSRKAGFEQTSSPPLSRCACALCLFL